MNIVRNLNLFLDSFDKFIEIGEKKLQSVTKRSLNDSEIDDLLYKYAQYCSNYELNHYEIHLIEKAWEIHNNPKISHKNKVDIYEDLYNDFKKYSSKNNSNSSFKPKSAPNKESIAAELLSLEISDIEKKTKKPLSFISRNKLKRNIEKKYRVSISYKFNAQKGLAKFMSKKFGIIQYNKLEEKYGGNSNNEKRTIYGYEKPTKEKKTDITNFSQKYFRTFSFRAPITFGDIAKKTISTRIMFSFTFQWISKIEEY